MPDAARRRYVPMLPGLLRPLRLRSMKLPRMALSARFPAVTCALPESRRGILLALLMLALLLRLPFVFTSTDGYMRDVAVTFHDEAMYMLQGRELLRGHLPYLAHWDNAAPVQWLVYAAIMLVTGGTLTGFRLFGLGVITCTAYVLHRCLAERSKPVSGWWAAFFYVLFASTLQAGQSFTFEHLLGLPFALILREVLAPPRRGAAWRRPARLLMLFGFSCWLAPSFFCLAPALALLVPELYAGPGCVPAALRGRKTPLSGVLERGRAVSTPVLVRSCMLLTAGGAGYVLSYIFYLLIGEGEYFLASVFEAHRYLAGPYDSVQEYAARYASKLLHSPHWLIMLLGVCFTAKVAMMLTKPAARFDPLLYRLLLLGVSALFMVYFRGNHSAVFLFYFLQALPVFALIMGYAMNFNLADLRWFSLVVVLAGVHHSTALVQKGWAPFIASLAGDNSQAQYRYGDRLYRAAEVMATFSTEREALIVCGEDDMLYLLTGADNPRFFHFPFHGMNGGLHRILKRAVPSLRAVVLDRRPLYITGREGDPITNRNFNEIGDLLQQRYVQVSNIDGTLIFLRKDKLHNIFAH